MLHAAAELVDATGRIPGAPDYVTLTDRLARSCGTRPENVIRILAAAANAGVLTEHAPSRYALTTTAAPDWTAALASLPPLESARRP